MTRKLLGGALTAAMLVVLGSPAWAGGQDIGRVDITQKGSLLVFPKVELRWNDQGDLLQDTFIDLSNDYPGWVMVQMYFFNGDPPLEATANDRPHLGYNWVDNLITLTGNEPAYWSVATGLPKGVSPFTMLDPSDDPTLQGRPTNDRTTDRMLRGFVLAWAVNPEGEEIRWNHLKGDTLIVRYDLSTAWEYCAYAFQTSYVSHGEPTGTPGVLHLGCGEGDSCVPEYDSCFSMLMMDFYATGAPDYLAGVAEIDTDLTLLPMEIDLTQETEGPVTTKAKFDIWNMNEVKFSNTERCITAWDQEVVGNYDPPNHFLIENLQTDKGKARIDGMASPVVCGDHSIAVPLLGVVAKVVDFETGDRGMAGTNLVGMGSQYGKILADLLTPPPELALPTGNGALPVLESAAPGRGIR